MNRCDLCGRFRRWEDLKTHFVPDTAFSSEDETWRECREGTGCKRQEEAR